MYKYRSSLSLSLIVVSGSIYDIISNINNRNKNSIYNINIYNNNFISYSDSNSNNYNNNHNDKNDKFDKKKNYANVAILSGSSSTIIANSVATYLGTKVAEAEIEKFSDGEISCKINESIRGKDVFIIQTCASPVDDNIMELLLTITAARRSGAKKVVAVVPYFGYRHHRRGLPISTTYSSRFLWSASGDLAKMLQVVGVDGIISVDLQRPGQGHEACFFDSSVPVETISTNNLFVEYFKKFNISEPVVIISPNPECVKKAKKFQEKLKVAANIDRIDYGVFLREIDNATSDSVNTANLDLLGDVNGATVIIVDDVVDTNYPIKPLCDLLTKQGAKRIIICASHGLFTEESCQIIEESPLEKVVVSDSIELPLPSASSSSLSITSKIAQVSTVALISGIIDAEIFGNKSTADDDDQYLE